MLKGAKGLVAQSARKLWSADKSILSRKIILNDDISNSGFGEFGEILFKPLTVARNILSPFPKSKRSLLCKVRTQRKPLEVTNNALSPASLYVVQVKGQVFEHKGRFD